MPIDPSWFQSSTSVLILLLTTDWLDPFLSGMVFLLTAESVGRAFHPSRRGNQNEIRPVSMAPFALRLFDMRRAFHAQAVDHALFTTFVTRTDKMTPLRRRSCAGRRSSCVASPALPPTSDREYAPAADLPAPLIPGSSSSPPCAANRSYFPRTCPVCAPRHKGCDWQSPCEFNSRDGSVSSAHSRIRPKLHQGSIRLTVHVPPVMCNSTQGVEVKRGTMSMGALVTAIGRILDRLLLAGRRH